MKPFILSVLMLTCMHTIWSQTDKLDSLLNEVLGDDKEMRMFLNPPSSFYYLYGALSADSKTYYAGREIGEGMVSINGSLYFFHSWGIFAGASGSWYSQFDPAYGTTVVSAGINKAVNRKKNLHAKATYSHYFYNSADAETEYNFTNSLGTGITWRSKWIGARLSMNLLFGNDVAVNLTPNIFSNITLWRFGKYNKIRISPEISAFIGSETVESGSTDSPSSKPQDSQTTNTTETIYGLLNTQVYLPVCLYIGGFDLELGYSLNFPVTQENNSGYPVSSFFSVSLGYMLSLN